MTSTNNNTLLQHQVYLIRHGEVAISPDICYGQLDCDLTDSFENDVIALSDFIRRHQITGQSMIISSPLTRCLKLSRAAQKQVDEPLELKVNNDFQEINFGTWEGLTWDQIGKECLDEWSQNLLDFTFPEGESARTFDARVINAWKLLNEQLRQFTTKKVIFIVAHAGVIRSILSHFLHIPLAHALTLKIDKISVSQLQVVPNQPALSRCAGINKHL